MLRNRLRFVFNGVCLASLPALAAFAWLWWHSDRVLTDRLELSGAGLYLRIDSYGGRFNACALARWPGRREARVTVFPNSKELPPG